MGGGCLDASYGGAKVVEGAAASGARDVFGLGGAQACCLQYSEGGLGDVLHSKVAVVHEPHAVGESVEHQCAHVGCRLKLEVGLVLIGVAV